MNVLKPKKRRTGAPSDPFYQSKEWRKFSQTYLATHSLCVECLKNGISEPARQVDHIVQRSKGAADFDMNNFQALCLRCHNIKRNKESRNNKAIR